MAGFFTLSEVQREKPQGLIAKCGSCGLYKSCKSPKMKPSGKGFERVLIVGEAPGQTEDERGKPFVGKSGVLLRDSLAQLGYDLDRDALTTNALICRPPNNATPENKQIGFCRPNLIKTIGEFKPRVVITLGKAALTSVLKDYWSGDFLALDRWIGWKIPIEKHWICPTFHPSYLLRKKSDILNRMFMEHLEAAFELNNEPPKQEDWKSQIEILYDVGKIWHALKEIDEEGGWVAVDYETNCLKPEYPESKAISFSVSNGKRTISYPWFGKTIKATSIFLKSPRTRKIASNLKMEERWTINKLGHPVKNWGWDTVIAAHCLDNRQNICSLKFQSLVKMGVPSYNTAIEPYLESHKGHYNRIHEIELGKLLLYGGMDSLMEHRLAMIQMEELGYEKTA